MEMKMEVLVCVAVSFSCVLAVSVMDAARARYLLADLDMNKPTEQLFSTFKSVFDRAYGSDNEETARMGIFEMNVQYIKHHNALYAKGEKSYFLWINQFTDLTHGEFLHYYTANIPTPRQPSSNSSAHHSPSARDPPDEVDWREKGCVTPVKHQGPCSSGWAFSTTGSIEAQLFMKTGKLTSLSAQQLIDCPERSGNKGCAGGAVIGAYESTMDTGGIDGEEGYSYVEKQQSSCLFNKSGVQATLKAYISLFMRQEWQLQRAVAWGGPISIAIDASHPSFKSYAGGVYDEPNCSQTKLNHAVLAVGYGKSPSAYWLVKNSWGTTWGESGYIRMTKDKGNQCGIATRASYPEL